MRFLQGELLRDEGSGVIDKLTHAVPQPDGSSPLTLGAEHLDVPHTRDQLKNVLADRERTDGGERRGTGFHAR